MAEIKNTYELKDKDLENVTGGGSGTIPEGGIAFENYDVLQPEYYYSQRQDYDEIVYIYAIGTNLYYTREKFLVEPSTNSWYSRCRSSGSSRLIENIPGFMSVYKYRLNVTIQSK